MVIKINADERRLISESFKNLAHMSQRISERLQDSEKINYYIFENPKWGFQIKLPDKKYQLVLELKEIKDE